MGDMTHRMLELKHSWMLLGIQYPPVNDHMAGWKIPIFNRVHTSSSLVHFPGSHLIVYHKKNPYLTRDGKDISGGKGTFYITVNPEFQYFQGLAIAVAVD